MTVFSLATTSQPRRKTTESLRAGSFIMWVPPSVVSNCWGPWGKALYQGGILTVSCTCATNPHSPADDTQGTITATSTGGGCQWLAWPAGSFDGCEPWANAWHGDILTSYHWKGPSFACPPIASLLRVGHKGRPPPLPWLSICENRFVGRGSL